MGNWRLRVHLVTRRLVDFYDSIWFYPTILSLAAFGLFWVTTQIDQGPWLTEFLAGESLPWWVDFFLFAGDAASAQRLLSVIAGMWATIIGISFSVTLITVQLTATKYIAQVLPLFERNNVNQTVLGVYLGTVIYALLVLRTVRTAEPTFTPYIGVNVAMVLAIAALFLLILFISNVINFVRPQSFLTATAADARGAIASVREPEEKPWLQRAQVSDGEHQPPEGAVVVKATKAGVIANIAWDALCASARHDLLQEVGDHQRWTLYLHKRVGDAVACGEPLGHLVIPEGAHRPERVIAWVRLAHEVRSVRRHRGDLDYSIEALAGLTVKGAIQGDLDVAFSGIDALFGVLTPLSKEPEPAHCLEMKVNGSELVIHRPVTDQLTKLMRELTLISEVALAPSLPLRVLTEGISRRMTEELIKLAEDDEWDAFRRIVSRVRPWYQSAFYHMDWLNGMRRLARDLVELAIHVRETGQPGAFESVLLLMVELREQMEEEKPAAREVLRDAFARLAREVDLPLGAITLLPEADVQPGGESYAHGAGDDEVI